jgi:hypothetical protein
MAAVKTSGGREQLQQRIAERAARFVADDGHDISQACSKALAEVLGPGERLAGALPRHDQIAAEVRRYQRTFHAEPHRRLLRQRRALAAHWMQILAPFAPHLVGPVLDGSATRYSPLHLQLFTDSAKEVEMALLDRGLDIRVAPPQRGDARVQERIGFLAPAGEASVDADDGRPAETGKAAAPDAVRILITVLDTAGLRTSGGPRRPPGGTAAGAADDDPLHPVERLQRATPGQLHQLLADTAANASAHDD